MSPREIREALEPFAAFAEHAVDGEGWTGTSGRERLCDWFGPSDFRRARRAIDILDSMESETDEVDAILSKLTPLEKDLLAGRCEGWGSWMFTAAKHMVSLGLGTERGGNISFDTPLARAAIAAMEVGEK